MRGCQGASAYQLQGRGPDVPNRKGGWTRGKVVEYPCRSFSSALHLKRHKQEQARRSAAPRRTLPQRGVQPQAREARPGRLQRSPRRRHTKSQNGCPKEARTAQLGRAGETTFCRKGEGDSRKNRGQDQCPPSHTAPVSSPGFGDVPFWQTAQILPDVVNDCRSALRAPAEVPLLCCRSPVATRCARPGLFPVPGPGCWGVWGGEQERFFFSPWEMGRH